MKNIVNLAIVLFVLLNQVFYSLPATSSLSSSQSTPTPSVSKSTPIPLTATATSDFGAYPPPVTLTPETKATTPAPTATPSPTALPATPTSAPTGQPTAIPTEENPNLPPAIKLQKDTLTYIPGQSIDLQWKLENTKSSTVKSSWRIELILPKRWNPVDAAKGVFNLETQQLEIIPSSFSDKLSVYTSEESGDQEIQATFFDNDVFLFNTSIFLRAKKTATILKNGGEIEGKVGNAKIKVTFPKDALPSDSIISIQTPAKFPGTLPFNGKRVIELTAEDLKGNKFHKFNGEVQIEIPYDPADIGIHPSTMALYWFDEETGAWRLLPGEADRARNVFVAQTNHFSLFALGENSWESRKIPPLDIAQIASFTGAASYSIPIDVPNGPGGIKPSISIDYNSMSAEGIYFETPIDGYGAGITAGAQPSWVGTGWSLSSGGVVLRSMGKDTGWDGDDTFSLAVGGMSMKLIPVSEGSGFIDYKSSDENFWKIRRIKQQGTQNYSKVTNVNGSLQYQTLPARSEDDKWVVWDKTGTRFTFDKRAYYMEVLWDDSRINEYNCGDGNRLCTDRPWGWFLTEILYPSGQKLNFTYEGEQDQKCYLWYNLTTGTCAVYSYAQQAMYPLEIQYPDGKTKVSFVSEGRSDFIWYWGDTLSQNRYEKKRLSSIKVIVDSTIMREYKLNYFLSSENPLIPGSRWTPVDPLNNNNNKNYERILALKSIAQYGLGAAAGGNKLPDITFSYTNQMFLTDVDNGQGGKASFVYEATDPNANGGEGTPFTAAGGDPDQNKNLYQGGGFTLAVNENSYINPLPNGWDTPNLLPVRPGQGYRLTCTVRNANGQVQFGLYYSNENTGAKNYSKLVDVTTSGGSYAANVVIPANANRSTPAIKYTTEGTPGSRITVTNCSGLPVLTHYRAIQRTLSDTITNVSYTYNYAYQGAATNDTTHSAFATLDVNRRSGASVPYTEFRGHSKVTVTYPNGLHTETSFYQDDINKGRNYDVRQYNGSLLLNRTITHWIDTPIVISDGQVSNICAKKTKNDACYLDQKVVWSFADWDESRDYGQGVTDVNSAAYVGLHKIYQYTTQAPYGYGNLQSVIEQNRPGSAWVSYRLIRNAYSQNIVDGGVTPGSTKYLVGLPGSINLYQCPGGVCDETLPTLVKFTCNVYDDPINGGSGICSLALNGATKTEVLDTPETGLITGTRTMLHFGDGSNPDYTAPHYSDTTVRYDSKGNRIRTTQYSGEGTKTSIASSGLQITEACFGVLNQPSGCQDDGYYAYPRWEKNALGQTTYWTIDYAHGAPSDETDPNGAITYATYDAFGRMTALIRPGDSSNSPTISAVYHDGIPSWIEVTPKNGSAGRKIYDGLGRLIQTQQGNVILPVGTRDVVVDYEYNLLNQITRQSVPVDIAVYDGVGAIYRKQVGSPGTTNSYDLLGRLQTVTAPDNTQKSFSFGVETAQTIQKASANHYQPFSEWLSFTQTTETVTRNGQQVQLVNRIYQNVWGQSVAVRSALPPYVYYRYDPAGNLLDALSWDGTTTYTENSQNYAQGNATSIGYDLAGRKVSMVDADMGSWAYAYDTTGNLARQKDSKSQATCLYYDVLNRLKGKNYQGNTACPADPGSGYTVAYTFDLLNANNSGKGRRTGMTDTSGNTVWEYDLRGRLIHEAKTILDIADGNKNLGTYHTYWSYNPDDSVRQMVYPNGETVNYAYNLQGSVSQVYSVQDATDTTRFYISATDYNAGGQAINRTLGNGINQTFTYYPWTQQGGRLQNLLAQKSGVPTYQNLSLTYDEVGNVKQLADGVANETLNFTYDNLNRLDLASGAYSEDPAYSALNGNISNRNGTTYTYGDSAHAHAVTSTANGRSFGYDLNGNMTTRTIPGGTYTLGYNTENQVTSITGGSTNARYVYDGDGKRVLAVVNGVRTVYIGSYFEAELGSSTTYPVSVPAIVNNPWKVFLPAILSDNSSGGGLGMGVGNFGATPYHTHPSATGQAAITWRTYYSAGEARVALRVQGNSAAYDLYYFLTDNLNSTTKTIKQDGTVAELRYSAWGEVRSSSGTTPTQKKYSGQYQAEAGLYFFGGRWVDPVLGRFVQPDSVIPDKGNPLGMDRYSFVANNPIRYADPTGHCWGVLSFVRGLPSYGTTCNNLDMALIIVQSDQASASDRVVAGAYITGEFVAHGTAVVYGGAAACGYASAVCYKALTSGSGILGLLCRDGDCTNEANAAGQSVQSALKTAQSVNDKLQRYLLNPDHPVGGSKAQWFEKALGFTKDNIADLAKQIVFNPQTAVQTEVTQFGVKYNQIISITGANGRQIDVLFVWIRNSDGIIRLVTAIPGSK